VLDEKGNCKAAERERHGADRKRVIGVELWQYKHTQRNRMAGEERE
jgi:hypothetical protein